MKVYPHHSDVDWDELVEWVSHGGGDEYYMGIVRRLTNYELVVGDDLENL